MFVLSARSLTKRLGAFGWLCAALMLPAAGHAEITSPAEAAALSAAVLQSPGVATGAVFAERPPDGRAAATSTTKLAGFPTEGASFAMLSTGDAASAPTANNATSSGTTLGGGPVRGGAERDVTVLRVDLNVPAGTNCLTNMDFRFLSEEYPEYVGSKFNDAFIAELDESTWSTTGNGITAERNFAFDPAGNPITVNAAGVTSMTAGEAAGTTYDGATPVLAAATPITPGVHVLFLSIFDVGDDAFDSTVLIDNIRFGRVANVSRDCKPGAQVVDDRRYVALGDSYSSGFGVSPYFSGTHKDGGSNDCQRSTRAYSAIVRDRYELDLDFHACQGGLTKDFYSGRSRDSSWNEKPQLDHLDRETGLVTFSIGGNDAKFAEVLAECILGMELLPFNTCHKDEKVTKPVSEALARLGNTSSSPSDITPYEQLFKEVRARAPYATRVAVGYPEFYVKEGSDRTFLPGGRCEGVKKADQRWMVEQIAKLNSIMEKAAKKTGFRFANPSSKFNGHELCSGGDEWIFGVLSDGKVHPTADGQRAIGQAVVERLEDESAEGAAYTVRKDETVKSNFSVPLGQEKLTVVAQWPGSDVPLSLTSPSGVRYTRESPGPGVGHDVGETYEQFDINNPEPGTWEAELFGADVAPGGEPVTVLPTYEPAPNTPPTAAISWADTGNGTLTFSSAGSTDVDGSLSRREWYVATGTNDEAYSDGPTVTVPTASAGRTVSLVVTDDRGDTAFTSLAVPAAGAPPAAPPVPLFGNTTTPVPAAKDLAAPKVTKLKLERRVRKKGKNVWVTTKQLTGIVRVRMELSEGATVKLELALAKRPTKKRVAMFTAKSGRFHASLDRLVKGLGRGKARLFLTVTDPAGNATQAKLVTRR